ncbi:apoptosis-inducing factor 3-like [Amphiura filiformis]|uniref:apoptosis-inducing factor 3-like n=1 Tax=Amphiura filiformis TaxID=82378 RepID=UPI003B21BB5C
MGGAASKKGSASGDAPDGGNQKGSGGGGASGGSKKAAGASSPGGTVEAVVCKVEDMKDGEMKEVEIGKGKALLVKEFGEFSAIGHKCTHYGAPLVKGVLCNGRVRCPWHGACFNTKTGDIEDFPGLDSSPAFEVKVDGDNVIVKANSKDLESHKRIKTMACHSPEEEKTILIVGGGAAAALCAETLRQEGFKGCVILATKEVNLPYDRTKLSKALESTGESLALRKPDFYSVYDIDVRTEMEAKSVDTGMHTVTFTNEQSINYDQLLVATGGTPRKLDIPGSDLKNICLLRTPEDGKTMAEVGKGKDVVIIGSSFIGMEVATYFQGKATSVSIVGRGSVPYGASLGEEVGKALQKLMEGKGIKFYMNANTAEFKGEDGQVTSVVLQDGQSLPAGLCVLGIGVVPATGFLEDSGLVLNNKKAVTVDKFMRTNKPNVFAAGDIADFPLCCIGEERVNIGHWQMASQHGRIAALNMLGLEVEVESVPYFWTSLFGKSVRYAGYCAGFEEVVIKGNLDELKFVAYYIKDGKVTAVASMSSDPIVSQFAELLASGKDLAKSEIESDEPDWPKQLSEK